MIHKKSKHTLICLSLSTILFALSAQPSFAFNKPGKSSDQNMSNILDLSQWKLTLPTNDAKNNSGAAKSIKSGELAGGYSSEFFYKTDSGKLFFYAPSNGATTTPGQGSDHTRSELREMYKGPDAVGKEEWNSARGGTMRGSLTVDQVSSGSTQATFAQIHGTGSAAFVLLVYRATKNRIEMKVYNSPGSSKDTVVDIVSGINLGQYIDYTLSYRGNTVTVTVNGTTKSVEVSPSWANTPVHFGAGAYHSASHSGNPEGDATAVTYSSLRISH